MAECTWPATLPKNESCSSTLEAFQKAMCAYTRESMLPLRSSSKLVPSAYPYTLADQNVAARN